MAEAHWTEVDRYFESLFLGETDAFARIRENCDAAGLPAIEITPLQGRFLELLARIQGARRVLEVGTLGGYSTAWLASGLPDDGRVVTLELDAHHAKVARDNLREAGVGDRVDVVEGPAIDTLAALARDGAEPFDLFFLDAAKSEYPDYLAGCLALARPGSVLVADNVVRDGRILEDDGRDEQIAGTRAFNAAVAAHPSLRATAIQTVGAKGYDGFALLRVEA